MSDAQAEEPVGKTVQPKPKRKITSEELFAGTIELTILHAGEEYRLRITKNGKLILTK